MVALNINAAIESKIAVFIVHSFQVSDSNQLDRKEILRHHPEFALWPLPHRGIVA